MHEFALACDVHTHTHDSTHSPFFGIIRFGVVGFLWHLIKHTEAFKRSHETEHKPNEKRHPAEIVRKEERIHDRNRC